MSWKDKLAELWKGKQSERDGSADLRQSSPLEGGDRAGDHHRKGGPPPGQTPSPRPREASEARVAIDPSARERSGVLAFQGEHRVQLPNGRDRRSKMQLIIGLDFGTSFSKVVLGESRVRYAVPMQGHENGVKRYTVPVSLIVDGNGQCRVGEPEQGDRVFEDLKMEFLQGKRTLENQVHMVAYLALLFRHCRGWLFAEKAVVYRDTIFDWFINIGLPTNDALSHELERTYHQVTLAAWRLSGLEGEITVEMAKKALGLPEELDAREHETIGWAPLHPDAIRAFPEFAAQVSSYVQSPRKSLDLHALIDIGGGTVDVTLFNVVYDKEEGNHRYPILARNVVALGTRFLIEERLSKLAPDSAPTFSTHSPVPSKEEMAQALGVTQKKVDNADQEFQRQVKAAWSEEFRYTKTMRYGQSRAWKEGLPVFVSGGGASCDFYRDALRDLFPPSYPWETRMERLPLPDNLELSDVDEPSFGRLAVAYGLSFDAEELGDIIRPENIEDARNSTSVGQQLIEKNTITKDMT